MPAKTYSVPYLTGFAVKPASISGLGNVTFTDGTNEITPNQLQCEAYGYTYNQASGTCSIFRYNTNLNRSFANENNNTQGTGNVTETGTNNTYIMGENNTVKGFSRNNIIIGSNNEIANGVNNANVFGTKGEVTADNSIVLGGNAGADNLGERQAITLMYGVQTTDGILTESYLNNTTDSYFVVPENTALMFSIDILAVRVGGSSAPVWNTEDSLWNELDSNWEAGVTGGIGDYNSWTATGVVINKSGVLSVQSAVVPQVSSGTTVGWTPSVSVTGTNFIINATGATDVTIEWASTVRFTQIKTGVTL